MSKTLKSIRIIKDFPKKGISFYDISTILSNPKEFYKENIIPYKSDLETWYIQNNSFSLYIKIIFVTAYVVVFPKSNIAIYQIQVRTI